MQNNIVLRETSPSPLFRQRQRAMKACPKPLGPSVKQALAGEHMQVKSQPSPDSAKAAQSPSSTLRSSGARGDRALERITSPKSLLHWRSTLAVPQAFESAGQIQIGLLPVAQPKPVPRAAPQFLKQYEINDGRWGTTKEPLVEAEQADDQQRYQPQGMCSATYAGVPGLKRDETSGVAYAKDTRMNSSLHLQHRDIGVEDPAIERVRATSRSSSKEVENNSVKFQSHIKETASTATGKLSQTALSTAPSLNRQQPTITRVPEHRGYPPLHPTTTSSAERTAEYTQYSAGSYQQQAQLTTQAAPRRPLPVLGIPSPRIASSARQKSTSQNPPTQAQNTRENAGHTLPLLEETEEEELSLPPPPVTTAGDTKPLRVGSSPTYPYPFAHARGTPLSASPKTSSVSSVAAMPSDNEPQQVGYTNTYPLAHIRHTALSTSQNAPSSAFDHNASDVLNKRLSLREHLFALENRSSLPSRSAFSPSSRTPLVDARYNPWAIISQVLSPDSMIVGRPASGRRPVLPPATSRMRGPSHRRKDSAVNLHAPVPRRRIKLPARVGSAQPKDTSSEPTSGSSEDVAAKMLLSETHVPQNEHNRLAHPEDQNGRWTNGHVHDRAGEDRKDEPSDEEDIILLDLDPTFANSMTNPCAMSPSEPVPRHHFILRLESTQQDPDQYILSIITRLLLCNHEVDTYTIEALRQCQQSPSPYGDLIRACVSGSSSSGYLSDRVLCAMQESHDDLVHHSDFGGTARLAKRMLIKVSQKIGAIPSTLFVQGVSCADTNRREGIGGFADIYRGSKHGREVALKLLRISNYLAAMHEWKQSFYREALLWRQLSHENILEFIGLDEKTFAGSVCMVSRWMVNGDVARYLATHAEEATPSLKCKWILQIIAGLSYLHNEGVIHGDFRGANILLDDDLNAKITDFGLSILMDAGSSTMGMTTMRAGAARWTAPEVIDSGRCTPQGDMYSFGCVCLEIFSGTCPYPDLKTNQQVMYHIIHGRRPEWRTLHESDAHVVGALGDLARKCWVDDPESRPRMHNLVQGGIPSSPNDESHGSAADTTSQLWRFLYQVCNDHSQ